jgi:hypothetical protein
MYGSIYEHTLIQIMGANDIIKKIKALFYGKSFFHLRNWQGDSSRLLGC